MKVEWAPLKEILRPRVATDVEPASVYPIAGVFGFGRGVLIRDSIVGAQTGYRILTRLRTGDVVYSKLTAFEGAIACVHQEADGYFVSPEFPVFEVDPAVSWRYLEHVLQGPEFSNRLAGASTGLGARRERVHPARFLELLVPLPSRPDQDRIAAHLRQLHVSRTGLERTARLVELIVERVAGAEEVALGSVLELQRRSVEVDVEATYREIGVRSFGKGLFIKEPVTGSALGVKRVFRIEPGDFIVSNVFGWEGAVGVAGPAHRGLIGSHRFMTWTPPGDLNVDYLLAYFRTAAGVARLAAASPGSAGRNRTLSVANFRAIKVPVPTPEQQDWVATQIHAIDHIDTTSRGVAALAAAILPAARNEIFSAMR